MYPALYVALAMVVLPVAIAHCQSTIGPDTEKRFPPLNLPAGFHATLFACDPLVEYPSVIAIGPQPGSLFVAHDYMTGLGVDIVRRDEIRILMDSDGDGYADKSTLFADGFNSIQGLEYHAGQVFVMHAPLLTRLDDSNGDGVVDQRRDLLRGLGLPPEENSNRLHCANGVVVGYDGWLYMALGDRGCDVARPEGDRLLFQEGGILRCRPDGRDLHIFSHGLRNVYDVALDEELNVFVRDNENDGGDYMIRVCHCFHGSDHGYPYLYRDHPLEALLPLADLGRGSSAGGAAYLETAFPTEYRESLFFCEWGRAAVRYPKNRSGSGFSPTQEIDFATTAANDPYGFKPTDLVVDRDGSLFISDWGDGQRPKRGRGRIYRISYSGAGPTAPAKEPARPRTDSQAPLTTQPIPALDRLTVAELFEQLNSSSHHARVVAQHAIEQRGQVLLTPLLTAIRQSDLNPLGRMHAAWILAHALGAEAIEHLFEIAQHDQDSRVRIQAVRAIGDLTDPILATHKLECGRGDESVCQRLTEMASISDDRMKLEVIVALGRLRWSSAPQWLAKNSPPSNQTLSHAMQQLLRRADNWSEVLKLVDHSEPNVVGDSSLDAVAPRAFAGVYSETIVDGLIDRLSRNPDAKRRMLYCELLSRVYNKPAAWTYWGFRPNPRPANPVAWERSTAIANSLQLALADSDIAVRIAVARHMLREQIPIPIAVLHDWLNDDRSNEGVAIILEALRGLPISETRDLLENILRSKLHTEPNRLVALSMLARELDVASSKRLQEIANALEEGTVLAALIRELAKHSPLQFSQWLVSRIDSVDDNVRAAVVELLAASPDPSASPHIVTLLADRDIRVRRAAARLAGLLRVDSAMDTLRAGTASDDAMLRGACLDSLRLLDIGSAVEAAIASLAIPDSQIAAIVYLGQFGLPRHLDSILTSLQQTRDAGVLFAAIESLSNWSLQNTTSASDRAAVDAAVARIQGSSGMIVHWFVRGPISEEDRQLELASALKTDPVSQELSASRWRAKLATGADRAMALGTSPASDGSAWFALSNLIIDQEGDFEFLVSCNGSVNLWLNGNAAKEDSIPTAQSKQETNIHRFSSTLARRTNRVLLQIRAKGATSIQASFRRKSSKAEHERLIKLALDAGGSTDRGREVFLNTEKSLCLKCHRWSNQGGQIGPDLAGIGSRFSRMHIVESLLEPSRAIAPSYETRVAVLQDGRIVTGVRSAENQTHLTLGDNQGKLLEIAKSDIEEIRTQPTSTMPDGLEQRLTDREFTDLIEFLISQKKLLP